MTPQNNLKFKIGDLFSSTDEYLGHGVNVEGEMNSGIAVTVKHKFPKMFEIYRNECLKEDALRPGETLVVHVKDKEQKRKYYFANIASQDIQGANAKVKWLAEGLLRTLSHMEEKGATTLSLPLIGAGVGGLDWESEVRPLIEKIAIMNPGINITIYSQVERKDFI